MKESHINLFTTNQLEIISRQSLTQFRRPRDECPLCCYKIRETALFGIRYSKKRSKGPAGDMNPKNSRKTVEISYPEPHSFSDSVYCNSQEEVGDNDKSQPSPEFAKNIARHIAAHLHVLMLLTIRLASLQGETDTQTSEIESDVVDIDNDDIIFHGLESKNRLNLEIERATETETIGEMALHKDGEMKQANKDKVAIPALESDVD